MRRGCPGAALGAAAGEAEDGLGNADFAEVVPRGVEGSDEGLQSGLTLGGGVDVAQDGREVGREGCEDGFRVLVGHFDERTSGGAGIKAGAWNGLVFAHKRDFCNRISRTSKS